MFDPNDAPSTRIPFVKQANFHFSSPFRSPRFGSPLFGNARFGSPRLGNARFGSPLFGSPRCDGFGVEFGLSFLDGTFFTFDKGEAEVEALKCFVSILWWLVSNDIDLSKSKTRQKYFASLRDLQYGKTRTAELRKYAEEEFKERMSGLKEANDRVDKLLGLTLVAIGWVAAQSQVQNKLLPWSLVILLLAAIVLLCGRWKVTSRIPSTFPDFVDIAKESGKDETPQFEFHVARQYHKAAYDNGELTHYTQLRLLLAAALLVSGLAAFALRA